MSKHTSSHTPESQSTEVASISPRAEAYEWLSTVVFAIIFCVLMNAFILRAIGVEGNSMNDTLQDGNKLAVSNLFYQPSYGDIVIIRKDSFDAEKPIVKRVIAVEGQEIDINFETGAVTVDGVVLEEDYIREPTRSRLDFQGPVTVPKGHVFVMGDNRNHSADSRYEKIGMVDVRSILGRAYFRVYPFSQIGFLS